ncbi:MAG: hypothetical protein ACRDS0_05030 [Pseudonocardiaceae bacterium]
MAMHGPVLSLLGGVTPKPFLAVGSRYGSGRRHGGRLWPLRGPADQHRGDHLRTVVRWADLAGGRLATITETADRSELNAWDASGERRWHYRYDGHTGIGAHATALSVKLSWDMAIM